MSCSFLGVWGLVGGWVGGRSARGVFPKNAGLLRTDSVIEPEVQWSTWTSEAKTVTHRGPRRPPLVVPQQQLSPQTKALLNDKNHKKVGEKTNKKKKNKTKTCTGWWLLACCIIRRIWYTETNAERKAIGRRRRRRRMIGMIVASIPIILSHPSVNQTLGAEQLSGCWIQIQVRD